MNSLLQRARRTVDDRLPARSQQQALRTLGDDGVRDLVARFVDAFERGDVEAITGLLTEDAHFTIAPWPDWYRGRAEISDSWLMPGGPPSRLRYVPTGANGQIALGTYARDDTAGAHLPIALGVLTLDGDRIAAIHAFRTPEAFPRFGLLPEVRDPA